MFYHVTCFVGLDGVGKTPLIGMLANSLRHDGYDVEVIQTIADPRGMTHDEIMTAANKVAVNLLVERDDAETRREHKYILLDRFPFPDEYVYGSRGVSADEFFSWDNSVRQLGLRYVLIQPPSVDSYIAHQTTKHLDDDKQEYQPIRDTGWVAERMRRYDLFARRTTCPVRLMNPAWFGSITVAYLRGALYGHNVLASAIRTDSPDHHAADPGFG